MKSIRSSIPFIAANCAFFLKGKSAICRQGHFILVFLISGLLLAACSTTQQAPGLAGSAWNLVTIHGQPIVQGSTPSLVFDKEKGQVSGNGSCNGFGGDYTTEGDSLSFGPLMSTLMACVDNGISEQESAYLTALQAVTRYEIKDGQLHLFGKDGQETLVFKAQ